MGNLWNFRFYIFSSIRNELINRINRSKLGLLWMIINPIVQVTLYTLILSSVLAAKLPGIDNNYGYSIYLIAGLISWSLFSEIVMRCLNIFIEQGGLLKKINFSYGTLPSIVVGSSLINYILIFIAMVFIFIFIDYQFNINLLWLIPMSIILVVFSLGLGLILGVMNVFVRDIGQFFPVFLQLWFLIVQL